MREQSATEIQLLIANAVAEVKADCAKMHEADHLRIATLEEQRDMLTYWLLRAYHARLRQGYEEGPTENETFDRICDVLANMGYDAANDKQRVKEMLARGPIFYVEEAGSK